VRFVKPQTCVVKIQKLPRRELLTRLLFLSLHYLGTFIPGSLGTSLAVCRDNNKYGGCSVTRMVKRFCCSAFCTNNFRTRNPQGKSIKFYRLPCDLEAQATYTRILQTTGINWHSGHICAEHWSRGYRANASTDLPDIPAPASQLETLEKKLKQAKAQLERKATKRNEK